MIKLFKSLKFLSIVKEEVLQVDTRLVAYRLFHFKHRQSSAVLIFGDDLADIDALWGAICCKVSYPSHQRGVQRPHGSLCVLAREGEIGFGESNNENGKYFASKRLISWQRLHRYLKLTWFHSDWNNRSARSGNLFRWPERRSECKDSAVFNIWLHSSLFLDLINVFVVFPLDVPAIQDTSETYVSFVVSVYESDPKIPNPPLIWFLKTQMLCFYFTMTVFTTVGFGVALFPFWIKPILCLN